MDGKYTSRLNVVYKHYIERSIYIYLLMISYSEHLCALVSCVVMYLGLVD